MLCRTTTRSGDSNSVAVHIMVRSQEGVDLSVFHVNRAIIVSDASVPLLRTSHQAVSAWLCWYLGKQVSLDWQSGGLATSNDAETATIAGGFSHLVHNLATSTKVECGAHALRTLEFNRVQFTDDALKDWDDLFSHSAKYVGQNFLYSRWAAS